jgi:hypothetical protein
MGFDLSGVGLAKADDTNLFKAQVAAGNIRLVFGGIKFDVHGLYCNNDLIGPRKTIELDALPSL